MSASFDIPSTRRNAQKYGLVTLGGLLAWAAMAACGSDQNAGPGGGGTVDGGTEGGADEAGSTGSPNDRLCSDAFCWQYPLPQGNALTSIAATSDDSVWAVGESGAVLHRENGTWRAVNVTNSRTLRAVWALSDREVWAVGDEGAIVHFDGTTWASVPSGTTGTLCGIWGAANNHIWAIGDVKDAASGELAVLFYDGTAWSPRHVPGIDLSMCKIWGSGPDKAWMTAARFGSEAFAQWDGKQWTRVDGPPYVGLLGGTDVDDLWSVSKTTAITYRRPKGETKWSHIPEIQSRPSVGALQVNAPDDVWLAGSKTFHWNGAQWETTDPLRGAAAMASAPGSRQLWLASGHHVRKGGQADARSEMASGAQSAWVPNDDRAMVLTRTHELLQFDGSAWNSVGSVPGDALLVNLSGMLDGTAIVFFTDARGDGDTIRSYDGAWHTLAETPPVRASNGAFAGSSARDIWFADSPLEHYDGNGWTSVPLPVVTAGRTPNVSAIHASSHDNVWVAGVDAYVARFDGASWKAIPFPDSAGINLTSVWSSGPTETWVAGKFTKPDPHDPGKDSLEPVVFHFDGSTWTKVAIPGVDGPKQYLSVKNALLSGRDTNHVWLALDRSYHSVRQTDVFAWDGSAWTERRAPIASPLRMWTTNSSTWMLGGADEEGGLVRSR